MAEKEETPPEHDAITLLLAKRDIERVAVKFFEEIDDLKTKYRSLNSKISRLKKLIEEGVEEYEEEEREPDPRGFPFELDKLPPGFQLDPKRRAQR